ncbi:MAG: ABC transporter ATP-binding protein [Archaeoglobaceae archaeon]
MLAAECKDVWMIYRSFMERPVVALKGVSVEVEEGEIFGVLGPNGAGKTTLVSVMSTLLIPSRGSVRILGIDALKDTRKVRKIINVASGNRLPWGMRVYECLRFYALCYGVSDRRVVDELLRKFELEDYRNLRFDELSAGNRQKLILARSMVNDPKLLFLDEPTANLDPDVARRIREMIVEFNEDGRTVILTTHNMREAEQLCDRIAFMKDGRIHAIGDKNYIKKLVKAKERIIIDFEGKAPTVELPHELKDGRLIVYVDDAERELANVLRQLEGDIKRVKVEGVTLEDVFIELSKRG